MFTTYSSANYREDDVLMVWYEQEFALTGYVMITRYATKKFAYIDMTGDAANTCADALVTKYTRSYAQWTLDVQMSGSTPTTVIDQTAKSELKSTIDKNLESDAGAFSVSVNVKEVDVKIVASNAFIASPATYFTAENQRDYT